MNPLYSINVLPLSHWISDFNYPLVIAGPCSIESRSQAINTAREISQNPEVRIFRAGIWKPRSSPHSFQGRGNKALEWLKEVKEISRLHIAVEVASPKHVELCLKNNIDILWVGARTTVNPFLVDEIVSALSGTNIPVLIKNPVNPDINLWIGAIERFYLAGLKKIVAVHRGFNTYEKTSLRNHPIWEIPIELKRLLPSLPIVCDPSHIAGHTSFVPAIAQKALHLNFDGLMIETHNMPQKALSDPEQQLNPKELSALLESLMCPIKDGEDLFEKQLEFLRQDIDNIDISLLNLLKKRMDVVEKIGRYKKDNNISVLQIKRWNNIINERSELGAKLGLNNNFIKEILKRVHKESIQIQHNIMMNKKK